MQTDTTLAPTDAEIDRLLAMHWPAVFAVTAPVIKWRLRKAVREAIARWGAPALASGEPVMWAFKYSDGTWHDASATEHSVGMRPLYDAVPPAPEVRVPLSDEQVDELASPYLLRMFGSIKIFNEVMRRFARTIERAHGITAKGPT